MNVHENKIPKMGRVTVKEIAQKAGVSIGTVDRVLHERPGVSERTKATVEAIARTLGYKPNILARNLSLNRQHHLRAFLPLSTQDSGYWQQCRQGIEAGLAEFADYGVELSIEEFDRYDKLVFRKLLSRLVKEPGDGLLMPPVLPDELIPGLEKLPTDYPCVFFDGSVEGVHPIAMIGQDARRAGYSAARMLSLLAPEAESFIVITPHMEDEHIRQRIEGFQRFFEGGEKGQRGDSPRRSPSGGKSTPNIVVAGSVNPEDPVALEAQLREICASHHGIGGMLVANSSGHSVGEWLLRTGHKDTCALVTWDLVPANEKCLREGAIDCVISQRPFDQGKLAVATLVRHVTGTGSSPAKVEIPIELWLRENLPTLGEAVDDHARE